MNFATHALDTHCLVHLRNAKTDLAAGPATPSRTAAGFAPETATRESTAFHSPAYRFRSGSCARVEYALFAITLATVGYLYLGVALAQALSG